MRKWKDCKTCHGTGLSGVGPGPIDCPRCNGARGRYVKEKPVTEDDILADAALSAMHEEQEERLRR